MPSSETTGSDDGPRILTRQSDGAAIACLAVEGAAPTVVFLPGFRSDMGGTKALALDAWCRARGQAFLRFDYTGHGQSSGRLIDGTIGQWALKIAIHRNKRPLADSLLTPASASVVTNAAAP